MCPGICAPSQTPLQTPSPQCQSCLSPPWAFLCSSFQHRPPAQGEASLYLEKELEPPEIYSELNLSNTFSPAQALQKSKRDELAQIFIFHVHSVFPSDCLLKVTKYLTPERSKSPSCQRVHSLQAGDVLQD